MTFPIALLLLFTLAVGLMVFCALFAVILEFLDQVLEERRRRGKL